MQLIYIDTDFAWCVVVTFIEAKETTCRYYIKTRCTFEHFLFVAYRRQPDDFAVPNVNVIECRPTGWDEMYFYHECQEPYVTYVIFR